MGYHERPAGHPTGQPDRPADAPAEHPSDSVDPAAVFPLIRPLTGLTLSVCSALAGSRRAYQQGDVIYVSPAMWDLLSHADGREMEVLLRVIEVVKLPATTVYSPVYTLGGATVEREKMLKTTGKAA